MKSYAKNQGKERALGDSGYDGICTSNNTHQLAIALFSFDVDTERRLANTADKNLCLLRSRHVQVPAAFDHSYYFQQLVYACSIRTANAIREVGSRDLPVKLKSVKMPAHGVCARAPAISRTRLLRDFGDNHHILHVHVPA